MAKRAVRVMMPTCSALMHTDAHMRKCVNAKMCKRDEVWNQPLIHASTHPRIHGFTLTELIVVVMIVSLVLLVAQARLFGLLTRNTFKAQVQEFVSTMQMAARAAAQSDRRYEVKIDLTEQTYLLREITSPDLSEVLEEEIIVEGNLGDNCWIAYVEFDDIDYSSPGESYTNEGKAKFRAGHSGWAYGGKIVLLDENEQPYSVVVDRLNRIVKLKKGDVAILKPKAQNEIPF
jgi:prepilin-type N-terminal cleavage/methylation domain-containing protein